MSAIRALHDRFVTAFGLARGASTGGAGGGVDEGADSREALIDARATRDKQVLASLAPATLAAYARERRGFVAWCDAHAGADATLAPLPASDATLSTWVGAHDALRPSSLRRKLAAIRLVHRWAAEPLVDAAIPVTLAALRGHARRQSATPPKQVKAATGDVLWRLADACATDTPIPFRVRRRR